MKRRSSFLNECSAPDLTDRPADCVELSSCYLNEREPNAIRESREVAIATEDGNSRNKRVGENLHHAQTANRDGRNGREGRGD